MPGRAEEARAQLSVAEAEDEPARSAAWFALAAGASAASLVLGLMSLMLLVEALVNSLDARDLGAFAGLGAAVACATTVLAFAEERAAAQIARGRVLLGLTSILAVALVATVIGVVNATWASALQDHGPEAAPVLALTNLLRQARQWEGVALLAVGPAAVAVTRAVRAFNPGARIAIGVVMLAAVFATTLFPDGRTLVSGLAYGLGVTLGDRFVPERRPTTSVPLSAVLQHFVQPLGLGLVLNSMVGPLATLPVFAWVLYMALTYKRAWLRLLPSGPIDAALPAWFMESNLAGVDADLGRHTLQRVALHGQHGNVLGIATGGGPTVALIYQTASLAKVAAPPSVVFFTWFGDGRAVITTGHAFDVIAWLTRSSAVVHDACPGSAVDELFARHWTDVVALAALAGPPTGPGSAERYLAHEAEAWSSLETKLRRTPALWLLACAWWFAAPRPVRLRGPLPA